MSQFDDLHAKHNPYLHDDEPPTTLDRIQSFLLRLLTLGAIVVISAFIGAIVALALVPPQFICQ